MRFRSHLTCPSFISRIPCDTRSCLLHAPSLRIFLTHRAYIRPSPYARRAIPASFVPRPLFNRSSSSSPSPLSTTSTSLRLRSYLSVVTDNSPPLCLSRTCSDFAPLQFPPPPPRSHVTTLLSLLILIDGTCSSPPAELVVFFHFALSVRMHRVHPPLCLEAARPSVPLHSPLFATLVARYITAVSLSRASISLSNCVSLAFSYLHRVSSRSTTG